MTKTEAARRAQAVLEACEVRLSPRDRARRRAAGELRKRALEETGARSYRALRARLNDGDDRPERRGDR